MSQVLRMGRAGSRTVAFNAMWNLLGRTAPIAVALAVTPALIHALGSERWGMFTIVLSLIGTFGIFDFGLGRALTRAVSESVGEGDMGETGSLVLTGLIGATALGALGGVGVATLIGYWMRVGLQISPQRQHEVLVALDILCASAPLVILNAALWGVVSAFQRFRTANLVNLPIVSMYYIGPLLVLHVWDSLVAVMLVLVGCRLVMTVAYALICLEAMPSLRNAKPSAKHLRPLLVIGGWMTVSNLTFPALLYVDRFLIASVLSVAAAGYYSTPFDLITRFSIVPIAVMTTAYPAMAASFKADQQNTMTVFRHSMVAVAAILFPACLIVTGYGNELMTFWVGADFAKHAGPVLCCLGVGILFTAVDGVVVGLIDGIGRPDVNAKFSIIELIVYIPVVVVLLLNFGIIGVAIAWATRCGFDFVVRLILATRLYRPVVISVRQTAPAILCGGILLILPTATPNNPSHIALMVAIQITFLLTLWYAALTRHERSQIAAWSIRMVSA